MPAHKEEQHHPTAHVGMSRCFWRILSLGLRAWRNGQEKVAEEMSLCARHQ